MKNITLFDETQNSENELLLNLLSSKYYCYLFNNPKTGNAKEKLSKYSLIEGDIRIPKLIFESLKDSQYVVILNLEKKYEVLGIKNIIEACQFYRIERIIYLSSILSDISEHNLSYISQKRVCERLIKSSGLSYTIIKGGFAKSFLASFIFHGKAYYNNSKFYSHNTNEIAGIILSAEEKGSTITTANVSPINLKDALLNFIDEQGLKDVLLSHYGFYDKHKLKLINGGEKVNEVFELLKLLERIKTNNAYGKVLPPVTNGGFDDNFKKQPVQKNYKERSIIKHL